MTPLCLQQTSSLLEFFSDCFFLEKIIFLIWIYILTKGPWHVFFLFALMWANRRGPSRCHINHHIEEACSDVLVLATFILFSCYFSICLKISMVHTVVTSKHSSCFSILTVQNKGFLSLSSIILKNALLWLLSQVGACSKINMSVYRRDLCSLRCICYQMSGRYCAKENTQMIEEWKWLVIPKPFKSE